jgi:hypothetical protein
MNMEDIFNMLKSELNNDIEVDNFIEKYKMHKHDYIISVSLIDKIYIKAIKYKNKDIINILSKKININRGNLYLFLTTWGIYEDIENIENICKKYEVINNYRFIDEIENGLPDFYLKDTYINACKNGHINIVRYLETVISVNILDEERYDILENTIRNGYYDIFKHIYDNNNEYIKKRNEQLFTIACWSGKIEIATFLFPFIQFYNIPYFDSAINLICSFGMVDMLFWLFIHNYNINKKFAYKNKK